MAKSSNTIEKAKERLRLKSEQLTLRLKIQDAKEKHKNVTNQLKAIGGRIR